MSKKHERSLNLRLNLYINGIIIVRMEQALYIKTLS